MIYENKDIRFIVVDSFCGFGGVTQGMKAARSKNGHPIAKVIACINHDEYAIQSHEMNHPECLHFTEDIRKMALNMQPLVDHVEKMKKVYPNAYLVFWSSLECTNFSNAKGGKPRDADSRTLANEMHAYYHALDPDYIMIENVKEFMAWGPLDDNGKPLSRKNGKDYLRWVQNVQNAQGECPGKYNFDFKLLNSADYGAHTRRIRYFAQFAKKGLPINWPEQTHAKNPTVDGLFQMYQPWNPVKEVLDFDDEGRSIFTRKKDLSERTLKRILAGLVKYVASGDKEWLLKYRNYANGQVNPGASVDDPSPTICTSWNHKLVQTEFLTAYYSSGGNTRSIDEPSGVVKTKDTFAKVKPCWLDKAYGGNDANHQSIEKPAGTVVGNDKHSLVTVDSFIEKAYRGDHQHQSIEKPAGTITTKDHHRLIRLNWLDKYYNGSNQHQSIDRPSGAIMPVEKHRLVSVKPFVMPTEYGNPSKSVDEPMKTITASRRHDYLINPQWGTNQVHDIDSPCFTLIARMDKMPPYLVQTESGEIAIKINESDCETLKKIKLFMAAFGIVDIKMRMLKVPELLKIMGMPEDYKYVGGVTRAKKFIGNAVTPVIPQKMLEEICNCMIEKKHLIGC
jgi:DNA (cytosine-5)-methyltransferase 1